MHDHHDRDRTPRYELNEAEQDHEDSMSLGELQECRRAMLAEDIAELERLEGEIEECL